MLTDGADDRSDRESGGKITNKGDENYPYICYYINNMINQYLYIYPYFFVCKYNIFKLLNKSYIS